MSSGRCCSPSCCSYHHWWGPSSGASRSGVSSRVKLPAMNRAKTDGTWCGRLWNVDPRSLQQHGVERRRGGRHARRGGRRRCGLRRRSGGLGRRTRRTGRAGGPGYRRRRGRRRRGVRGRGWWRRPWWRRPWRRRGCTRPPLEFAAFAVHVALESLHHRAGGRQGPDRGWSVRRLRRDSDVHVGDEGGGHRGDLRSGDRDVHPHGLPGRPEVQS